MRREGEMRQAGYPFILIVGVCLALAFLAPRSAVSGPAVTNGEARPLRGIMPPAERERLNANRVTIVTGPVGLTYIQLGADLSKLLDDQKTLDLRVLATVSRGSLQNIDDLLNLNNVDLALVQADVLDWLERQGGRPFADIKERIGYITRLYDEEIHILARGPIRSIDDLRGKRVNVGERNSGAYLTATNMLGLRNIDVQYSYDNHDAALARLKAGGPDGLDAMIIVAGQPAGVFQSLARGEVEGLQLHFVSVPADAAVAPYNRGSLTSASYPNIITAGSEVDTLVVPAVMAVYLFSPTSARYLPIEKFARRFVEQFAHLQEDGFHPKWRKVDLRREVPGWRRFAVMDQLLSGSGDAPPVDCEEAFHSFLRAEGADPAKTPYAEVLSRRKAWVAPTGCQ